MAFECLCSRFWMCTVDSGVQVVACSICAYRCADEVFLLFCVCQLSKPGASQAVQEATKA